MKKKFLFLIPLFLIFLLIFFIKSNAQQCPPNFNPGDWNTDQSGIVYGNLEHERDLGRANYYDRINGGNSEVVLQPLTIIRPAFFDEEEFEDYIQLKIAMDIGWRRYNNLPFNVIFHYQTDCTLKKVCWVRLKQSDWSHCDDPSLIPDVKNDGSWGYAIILRFTNCGIKCCEKIYHMINNNGPMPIAGDPTIQSYPGSDCTPSTQTSCQPQFGPIVPCEGVCK